MRIALALLLLTGVAHAERPPKSAIAAVDNLLEDLEQKRFDAAVTGLARELNLANLPFQSACKKAFPKAKAARSTALAKCLASDLKWPARSVRIMGQESKTATGWRVVFDELSFGVRKRGKDGYEVFSIEGPKDMSSR